VISGAGPAGLRARRRPASRPAVGALLALLLLAAPARAQTAPTADPGGSDPGGWQFGFAPYFWLASLDGTIALGGLPQVEVEAGFGDLFENLDFALSGFLVGRNDKWVVISDISYTALSIEETVASTTIDIGSTLFWVSAAAGPTLADDAGHRLDLFAGLRYTAMMNDATGSGPFGGEVTNTESWVDPLVGFNATMMFSPKFGAGVLADFAGFGVGSEFTYDVMPTVSYTLSEVWSLHGGYRWLDTDVDDSGFRYDMLESGPLLGVGLTF
jgi:hypothetical protein